MDGVADVAAYETGPEDPAHCFSFCLFLKIFLGAGGTRRSVFERGLEVGWSGNGWVGIAMHKGEVF